MTVEEFKSILVESRDGLLAAMRKEGFWSGPDENRRLRHDATPWDINDGYCDDFADEVVELARERHGADVDAVYVQEIGGPEECAHTVLLWEGKLYDAECINGVRSWKALPIHVNRRLTRAQAIAHGRQEKGRL